MPEYRVIKSFNKWIVKCPYYGNVRILECHNCTYHGYETFYTEPEEGKVLCTRGIKRR